MRRATRHLKLDANHRQICADLRALGVEVVELFEPVDCLVFHKGNWMLLELKVPGSKARFTRLQLGFISHTRMPIAIARDADEALRYLNSGEGLRQEQKDALAGLLRRQNDTKLFQPGKVFEVLSI